MSTDIEAEYVVESEVDTQLSIQARVEIDTQISTAKRYPRSLKAFKQQALEMATLDEETAASMFYVLPRGGKKIEGPSIRMAEVVASCFGNLRFGSRIVDVGDSFITAQGVCQDMEKNTSITYEVRRRITNKNGTRYNDDMIQTTGLAAASVALREAIFRIVPRSLYKSIVDEAKLCSVGKASTMSEKRHKAFDWFKKAGATEAQLLEFLGRNGIDDVTIDDIITLRGLVTAIKDGETTVDDALRPASEPKAGSKVRESSIGKTPEASEAPIATDEQKLSEFHERLSQCTTQKACIDLEQAYDFASDDAQAQASAWVAEQRERIKTGMK